MNNGGRAHRVDGNDEIQAGENRRKTGDEHAGGGRKHLRGGKRRRIRRIEGPAGVHAAGQQRINGEKGAAHEQIPACQVQARECQVARPDHHGNEKVAERRRDRGNQKEPHHDHAVHGEELVVGLDADQLAVRGQQVETDHGGGRTADAEEQCDRDRVQNADALVVEGRQPRPPVPAATQIVFL
jgi:hypothetical protein